MIKSTSSFYKPTMALPPQDTLDVKKPSDSYLDISFGPK